MVSMASSVCGTCRARKLSCDKTLPKCLRCARSKRVCLGYDLRLNWPRNHSRAMVASPRSTPDHATRDPADVHWINVVSTDMRLHFATNSLLDDAKSGAKQEQLVFPGVPDPRPALSRQLVNRDTETIQYFESVVVHLLPGLSLDRRKLSGVLVRLSLLEDTQSSRAVYSSILALVTSHRGDSLAKVQKLKNSALRDLKFDADSTRLQVLQHVAANILLAVLGLQETFRDRKCRSDWVGYLVGSKKVSDTINKETPANGSDESIVLGWVHHFEVLARFTFRHWRTEQIAGNVGGLAFDSNREELCASQVRLARSTFLHAVPDSSAHAHPVVRVLAEVSAISMSSTHSSYSVTEYQKMLADLRMKMNNVATTPIGLDTCSAEVIRHEQNLLQLSRLAGLIYLERVSNSFSGRSTTLDAWTQQAVLIISQMEACLAPFALFVIGCELDNDADRIVILRLFARIEERPHLRSMMEIRSLIQTAWNQQDLAGEEQIGYVHKLNLVISSRDVMPSLI